MNDGRAVLCTMVSTVLIEDDVPDTTMSLYITLAAAMDCRGSKLCLRSNKSSNDGYNITHQHHQSIDGLFILYNYNISP